MAKGFVAPNQPPSDAPHLTDSQIDKIEMMIGQLASTDQNHVANAFRQALSVQKNRDDKRKVIAVIYSQLYFVMLGFQMAMNSTKSAAEIKTAIEQKGKREIQWPAATTPGEVMKE